MRTTRRSGWHSLIQSFMHLGDHLVWWSSPDYCLTTWSCELPTFNWTRVLSLHKLHNSSALLRFRQGTILTMIVTKFCRKIIVFSKLGKHQNMLHTPKFNTEIKHCFLLTCFTIVPLEICGTLTGVCLSCWLQCALALVLTNWRRTWRVPSDLFSWTTKQSQDKPNPSLKTHQTRALQLATITTY